MLVNDEERRPLISIPEAYKPHITLDRGGYCAFLHEQGVDDIDIDCLDITLCPELPSGDNSFGYYSSYRIVIYISTPEMIREINDTLLHETRHFLQDVLHLGIREGDADDFANQHSSRIFLKWIGDFTVHTPEWARAWWIGNR